MAEEKKAADKAKEAADKAAKEAIDKAAKEAADKAAKEEADKAAKDKAAKEATEAKPSEAILKRAAEILNSYPKIKAVSFASDGTPFFKESDAANHALRLKDTRIVTVKR